MIQAKAPAATIIVMGIFPRNDNMAFIPLIDSINHNLSEFSDGHKIRYLNINDKLADNDGRLIDGMMNAQDKLSGWPIQAWFWLEWGCSRVADLGRLINEHIVHGN